MTLDLKNLLALVVNTYRSGDIQQSNAICQEIALLCVNNTIQEQAKVRFLTIYVRPHLYQGLCDGVVIYMMRMSLTPSVPVRLILHAETQTMYITDSNAPVGSCSFVSI